MTKETTLEIKRIKQEIKREIILDIKKYIDIELKPFKKKLQKDKMSFL